MFYKKVSKLLSGFLSLSLLLNGLTFAYQANRDHSFGEISNQEGLFDPTEVYGKDIVAMAVQNDGKILVGGFINSYDQNTIIRLNSDGSRDNSFNIGNEFDGYSSIDTIVIQDDGKIIVGGYFESYDGQDTNKVIRLNSNGSRDNSFNVGNDFDGYSSINTIVIQDDGKILVGGCFYRYNKQLANGLIRLNSDGSRDNSFDIGDGFDNFRSDSVCINTITIQNDGKILVGGDFESYDGQDANRIIRLNSDGSIDSSFDIGNTFSLYSLINTIAIQNDGKILVGGYLSYGQNTKGVARLNSDGSIDDSLEIGDGINGTVSSIVIQNNGKILIGGNLEFYSGQYINGIIRLNSDWSVDDSLNLDFLNYRISTKKIIILNDKKILIGTNYGIIRLKSDGSLNTNLPELQGFDGIVRTTAIQNDGKIIVGGEFYSYNSESANNIVRLNTNGSIDNTFNSGDGFEGIIHTIAIQNDGKIIVGGEFYSYNSESANNIVRLNTNGSIDNTFNSGDGFDGIVHTIAIQNDGKIIVGGEFYSYNSESANNIVRLNTNGSIDNTFNPGDRFDLGVLKITIQEDGKILIGEATRTVASIKKQPLSVYAQGDDSNFVRLNSDGSIDTSFAPGYGFNGNIHAIVVQKNGKILVGGDFYSYNGQSANKIIRLNSDGSIDRSFYVGNGPNCSIYTISIDNNGEVLIGGCFSSYNGINFSGIIKLNSDGSFGDYFNYQNGINGTVYTTTIQNDGRILVGGDFSYYNGQLANNFIALIGNSPVYLPNTEKLNQIQEELDGNGYEFIGGFLGGVFMGERNISLQKTNGKILNNLIFGSEIGLLSLPKNLQFKNNNGNNYTGVFAPITPYYDAEESVNGKEVWGAIQVGNPQEKLLLSNGVAKIIIPVYDEDAIGFPLNIYSSQDGSNRTYEKGTIITTLEIEEDIIPVASFTTNHFTYFAITENTEGVFLINNGDSSTDSQNVTLTIAAPGASQMRFKNQGSTRSDRENYSTNKSRTLSEGFGNKTVNAQFEIDGQIFDVSESILYGQESSQTGQEGQGHIRLSILGGETECVYGTSVNLGNQDSHLNPAGYVFTGDFAPANRYCSDYKGLEGRVFTIQTTDLTSQNGEAISGTNVFISHDTPAVQGDLSCTGHNGEETQFFASPLSLMEKIEQENNDKICRVDLENVKIKVNVPAYQAPGSYQGVITITLPNGF